MNQIGRQLATVIVVLGLLAGCAPTTNQRIEPELGQYGYAYVGNNPEAGDSHGTRELIQRELRRIGLTPLSEQQLSELSTEDLARTLLVSWGYELEYGFQYVAHVRIEIEDVLGAKIYSSTGQGKTLVSFSWQQRLGIGVEDALSGFRAAYPGFDSSIASTVLSKLRSWPSVRLSEQDVRAYLDDASSSLNPIEGIWASEDNSYRIAIVRDLEPNGRDYYGFVLSTGHPLWRVGQIKVEVNRAAADGIYSVRFYRNNFVSAGGTATLTDGVLLEIPNAYEAGGGATSAVLIKSYPEVSRASPAQPNDNEHSVVSHGSGFLIASDGLVATNYHVVAGMEDITVRFQEGGIQFAATVALKDESNDLAILRLRNFDYERHFSVDIPYRFAPGNAPRVGQEVITIGFPLSDVLGDGARLSTGTVSSLYGVNGAPNLLQVSNPIQPGNSGGPLLNRDGELIGVVVATLNAKFLLESSGTLPQNVNFAVKAAYLQNLVEMMPEYDFIGDGRSSLGGLQLEDQVSAITPFMAFIRAE